MKIVIDIPEKDWQEIVFGFAKNELIITDEVIKSVAQGTLLSDIVKDKENGH